MVVSPIMGTTAVFAQGNPATEVIYGGITLNAETPYLVSWVVNGDGLHIKAQADDTLAEGEAVLAYFDATTGTLTYRSGMELTTEENAFEPDFGWNTGVDAALIGDAYYGIKANGDLTIDLGGFNNFIYMNWNTLFVNDLYGIYADGDITITGDGYLKVPATLAQNTDATNGDADANPHYSYGIYSNGGNVTLDCGTIMIFSKMYQRWEAGTNANSIGIYADGDITLGETVLKFRYNDTNGSATIQHFGKAPADIDGYVALNLPTASIEIGELHSLAYAYVGTGAVNSVNYAPAVTFSFNTNGGNALADAVVAKGTTVNLDEYVPSKAGNVFDGWYTDNSLSNRVTSLVAGSNATFYAKWKTVSHATEITYCGVTLNASNPYLVSWLISNQGRHIKAQANDTLADGETVLAYFDATTGTLTYRNGMELTTVENGYESDFGWNTYTETVQLTEGGAFYGIKADGDLTIDLGGYNNYIYQHWNKLFKNDLYGIWVDGDLTIKGNGYLKVPATLAQNINEANGDADANPHYSYGLYATGDVNLQGGCVKVFSQMYQRWEVGTNANSTAIYAGGNINLEGTTLKIRYQELNGSGNITYFSKTPVGIDNYNETAVPHISHDAGEEFKSLAYPYTTDSWNNNSFDYIPIVAVTDITLNKDVLVLERGNSATLTATITPTNATNQNIIWSSDNEAVATVNGGVVSAVAKGEATITAKTEDGTVAATCKVTVVLPAGEIRLVIDGGDPITPDHKIAVNEDGVVFVPMVETFRRLGVEMTWKGNGVYEGMGNNGDIIVNTTTGKVEIDWVEMMLPAAPYLDNGTAMVPAYLIEDAVKTEPVVFDEENNMLLITSPDPNDTYYGGADIGAILKTLPAGTVIINQADLTGTYSGKTKNLNVNKSVSVTIDGVSTTALQLETLALQYGAVPEIGDISYTLATTGKTDFGKDDIGVIHFKARATAVNETGGTASLRVLYERKSDWSKLGIKEFEIKYNEWNDYYLVLWGRPLGYNPPSSDWLASECSIKIGVGALSQTVQVADFEVIYFGKNVTIDQVQPDTGTYHGMDDDALWRKEAFRRIEKYRKDDVAVRVVDEAGNPVEGVEIDIKQTENDFIFGVEGCHDEFVNLDINTIHGYNHDLAMNSFNAFVCGLEMKLYKQLLDDGTKGIEMANEAFRRGMRVKGHALMWDSNTILDPLSETGNYQDLSYEELYRRSMEFFIPDVYSLKGKIDQWDLLNEPHTCNFVRKTLGTTRLYSDVAKMAHAIDPDTKLYVTEAGTTGKDRGMTDRVPVLVNIVKQMQDEGAPIDGIGLQTHVSEYHYPQGLYRQLDECAQVVDEVAVTEFDFYHEKKENAGKYAGDILTAAFSHPKCNTFIAWGHHSLNDERDTGLFYDLDWNEKPGKAVWDNLVNNVFKTKMTVTSDANGRADFRGYHGEYEITVKYNGKERTFEFGLLKDADNYIDITVGDKIYANVSCGKYINIPDSVDYPSISEAEDAMLEEYGRIPYISLVLEKNLKGVLSSGSLALDGGTLSSNSSYTSGSIWGSSTGLSSVAWDDGDGRGIAYKNAASGTFDLSHLYSGSIYNEGNMEVSAMIHTRTSRKDGFSLAMGYTTSGSPIDLGYIKTSSSGYYVETLGGAKIELADNAHYNVIITLLQTEYPNVYDIKYTVEQNNTTVIGEITETQSNVKNLLGLKGISLRANCNGAEDAAVLILKQARVKFYTYDDMVSYQSAGNVSEALYDSLRHYNTANIVSLTDASYLSGDSWGTATPETAGTYFEYGTHTDHLYSRGAEAVGAQTIKKNIGAVKSGDSLDVDFDFYVDAPNNWVTSQGYADVRLESADGTLSRSLIKESYASNIGFRAEIFADASGTYKDTQKVEFTDYVTGKGPYNRNNLHINLKLTPNASGNYDANMTLVNELGNVNSSWTITNYVTGAEFLKLNTFAFESETVKVGTAKGMKMAGIKNVIIKKTSTVTKDGSTLVLSEGDTVGIKFTNTLARPFDAQLVLVRYVGDKFSSMKLIDFNGRRDANGYLSIRVEKEKEDEDRFMVMLLDGNNALKPLKSAEMIVLSE